MTTSNLEQTSPPAGSRYLTWKRAAALIGVVVAGGAWFVASLFLLVALLVGEYRPDFRQDIGDVALYVPLVGAAAAILAVLAPSRRLSRGLALVALVVGGLWFVMMLLILFDFS